MPDSLVQTMFDGPIDVIGDVHGEIDALVSLLRHLGYDEDGRHPEQRRLVFVGDLVDRGPDSPAVVALVQNFMGAGRAQCVLGNHEFNLLLKEKKLDNHWFFGQESSLDRGNPEEITPAVLADASMRKSLRDFFSSLPLVLERPDLRVVHACWDDQMVELARHATSTKGLYRKHFDSIDQRHQESALDKVDRELEHQNLNPVKLLTSGREYRTKQTFEAGGKLRHEKRVEWWKDYHAETLCLFGHYSNDREKIGKKQLSGRAICVDFSVGKRWEDRKRKDFDGKFKGYLAAVRIPERRLVFDDGQEHQLGNEPHAEV